MSTFEEKVWKDAVAMRIGWEFGCINRKSWRWGFELDFVTMKRGVLEFDCGSRRSTIVVFESRSEGEKERMCVN